MEAVGDCYKDFSKLAAKIADKVGLSYK
jgi:hypothetical protein